MADQLYINYLDTDALEQFMHRQFEEMVMHRVLLQDYDADDSTAADEAWKDFIDMLIQEGDITAEIADHISPYDVSQLTAAQVQAIMNASF